MLAAGTNVHADDDTALRAACQNGGADVAEVLLKAGADVHAKDDVVQRAACRERHVRIVGLLLDAVADVHADNDSEDALCAASKDTLQWLSCCSGMAQRRTWTVFTARIRLS